MSKYSDIVSDGGMDPRNEYEKERESHQIKEAAEKIKGLIDIQKQNGNYNCNEYMYGMLIGLECAYFSLLGEEGKFTERPKEWLDDNIPKDFKPEVADETYGHLLLKHIE
jgi:hypothetical protein